MGAINCETNAGIHTMKRANQEGGDLIEFFNQFIPSTSSDPGSRIKARTASFCTERSGHYDAFDQGITFFLPNMTWIQPPGYVHKMVNDAWAGKAISASVSDGSSCTASAGIGERGPVVRLACSKASSVTIKGGGRSIGAEAVLLHAEDL